jgi:glucose/arabinose dehydrogenase
MTKPCKRRDLIALLATIVIGALSISACGTTAENSAPTQPATAAAPAEAALPTVTTPAPETAQAADETPTQPAAITESVATTPTTDQSAQVASAAPAAPVFDPAQTALRLTTVANGLLKPDFLTHAGDGSGRLFVVEQAGRIRIIDGDKVVETPFLDISDRVGSSSNEQGLLGLAFAPDYASSGTFFVNYTNRAGDTVISRFQVTADAQVADPASETLVLTFQQPAPNHNGGMILFGPDGMLWVGTGDGGASNDRFGNGQNPQTLLGKMLRIDVMSDPTQPYTIPADNPWVTAQWNGQAVRGEIWALGLRNPWRYSFDATTNDLWIADVGQNTWEEVNFVAAGSAGGLNFGWPLMEGLHCFQQAECDATGLLPPVIEYDHSGNCSITGGHVYRGSIPALQGVYFYADYCSMRIWAATPAGDGTWKSDLVLQSDAPITSWGADQDGELYIVEANGHISRLELAE